MSIVYLSHAVNDEHSKARDGEPGDQTGKEVCTRAWYRNPKGWRVFRPKDPSVAEKIAWDAEKAAENPNIGYDQGDRLTLYKAAEKHGFNCADVTEPCECDCSSLVQVCILYAGINVGNFNTASEPKALLKTKAFEELTGAEYTDSPDRLRRGDVLITRVKGHTCIVINYGKDAEPIPSPEPMPDLHNFVRIKGGSVRVREGGSTKTRCIGIAHRGETFPLLGTGASGWYKIKWSGVEAYITNKTQYTEVIERA